MIIQLDKVFYIILILILGSPAVTNAQKHHLSLEMIAETKDNSLLSQVVSLDMKSSGDSLKIYLADVFLPSILILEKQGNNIVVTENLGREGKGPGDFIEVTSLQMLEENNLMAYDRGLGRVTVFNLDSNKIEYIFNLNTENSSTFPVFFFASDLQDSNFYAQVQPYFKETDEIDLIRKIQLQKYDSKGLLLVKSLMTKPSNDAFIFRKHGNMSVNPQPVWGNKSIFRFAKNNIYYIWTGNNEIEVYSKGGAKLKSISFNIPQLDITDDDRQRALEFEAFMMDMPKEELKDEYLKQMPKENWPWVYDFLIDDKNRFWIGRPNHLNDDSRVWQVHNNDGILIDEVNLPSDFTVHQIKNNLLIGELFNFDDFSSTVQVFQIHQN